MSVQYLIYQAEKRGELIRPLLCEGCDEEKPLIRHHRDYSKPLLITWLCYSCHGKEHRDNRHLKDPTSKTKLIRVDGRDDEIFRLEAIRQSSVKGMVVPKSEVLAQFAKKLNKRYRHVRG